ncbi:MAG: hypothetical protein HY569_01660 [Candidatus Magasanikbacteria bacterium]|nr:hypothetical protein [Candidatus Magasanikbacteria bacterium]
MRIIDKRIIVSELRKFLNQPFPEMIKFVVDIEKEILALGGEVHADAEEALLENGSEQKNLWGGNVYPDAIGEKLKYNSLINIRPSQNNRSLDVQDESLKNKIKVIVYKLLPL